MLEPPEPADNLPPARSWLLRPDPRPPPPPLLSPPKLPMPAMEAWEETYWMEMMIPRVGVIQNKQTLTLGSGSVMSELLVQ
ncbi:hypothetical protein EYF80_006494 [Liparis tanakae]|uniref:Uncharacterized protein n=1 Tax=Liparis tanakae TaxID=230148 RepID=A0A4Z2IZJ6_9TELE|nr:hypothetical protein EYF80_006494 [Liparis tanakae]